MVTLFLDKFQYGIYQLFFLCEACFLFSSQRCLTKYSECKHLMDMSWRLWLDYTI